MDIPDKGFNLDATLELVNQMLPRASAIGAYAMGMATAACSANDVTPTDYLMEQMKFASSIEGAAATLDRWLKDVGELKNRGEKRNQHPESRRSTPSTDL